MIDLHLHTTASDGRSTPEALVDEARDAGVTVLAITDHDTVAGLAAGRAAATRARLSIISGIEITAIHNGRDVHVLGYFFDPESAELLEFLSSQRLSRRARLDAIIARLETLGLPIGEVPFLDLASTEEGKALGRPLIAQALVSAGHVADIPAAFDLYLAEGRPAYVPRVGPPPAEVFERIGRAGGLASLAHPAKLGDDELVLSFVRQGLPAIEVYHPDHDPVAVMRYLRIAEDEGLLVTGGSDYHGPGSGRDKAIGLIGLPADDFERFHHAGVTSRPGPSS